MTNDQTAGAETPLTQPLDNELERALSEAAERNGISLDETETPESNAQTQELGEGSDAATAQDGADADASAETTEETKSGTQASPKEKGARAEGEETQKGEGETQNLEGEDSEEKLSPYAKRQRQMEKERKRLSESWKQLETEKQEVRKLREELAQAKTPAKPQSQTGYTPEQYEAFARSAEERGEYELAETAKQEAAKLRQEQQAQQTQQQQGTGIEDRRALEQAQAQEYQKARAEIPELQDPKSPLATQVVDMLRRTPDLLKYPNGPALAARYVAAQTRAARVPELETKVKQLQTKLAELEAATSVGGGTAGRVNMDEPAFDSLSLEDQKKMLFRELAG